MAVTYTNLDTNFDTTNTTGSYTTGSITPTANQPVLLALLTTVSGTCPTPIITGCNLTWTLVDNTVAAARTAWLFLGIGASPTTGTLSIAGDGTTTVTSALWTIAQCANVDTTTANGVVQTVNDKPGSATSSSTPFGTTVTSGNGTFGVVGLNDNQVISAGTGWTGIGGGVQATAPVSALLAEGQTSTAQQNVTSSWSTAGNAFVVGAELKVASGSTPVSLSETGTGTDALTVTAAVPLTGDTATATDALTVSVAVTLTDTATGTEDLSTGSPVALGDDAATATDALAVDAVALTLADTATGADALTVAATVPLTGDTATATDALSVTVPVALSDTATATDALTVSVAVTLTDDATATDAIFQKLPRPHLPGTVTFPVASLGTAARAVDTSGTAELAADTSATVSLINADATAVVATT